MKLKIIGILLTLVSLQACSPKKNLSDGNKIFWISGFKTECDAGAGKTECLLVSKEEKLAEAKWQNFYAPIDGFTFEPGFVQKIEVKTEDLSRSKIPADRSSIKYTLVKMLERKKDIRTELQGDWDLYSVNGVYLKESKDRPRIVIDLNKNMISGSNGCNNFSGIIHELGLSSIKLERTMATLRACIDMPTAPEFDDAFAKIESYEFENKRLMFLDSKMNVLLTFTKKEVSKADTRIHDIWVAIKIKGETISRKEEMPRMELNLNTMQVFGNNGCNEYNGTITEVTESKILFGAIATTRKMCRDMDVSNKFDQAMQKATSYKYTEMHLVLLDKDGNELISFRKVD